MGRTGGRHLWIGRLGIGFLVVAVLVVGGVAPVDAVTHRPPVRGEVVDPFRPPSSPYGPGNRGIDYAVPPGTEVATTAEGIVTFAGQVGGGLHVTVRHADGLRTTYSYLDSISVHEGDEIATGTVVGTSGSRLHLGVRTEDGTYLDPSSLFALRVTRLVPGGDDGSFIVAGPGGPGLWDVLWGLVADGLATGGRPVTLLPDIVGAAPAVFHYTEQLALAGASRDTLAALAGALADPGPCTATDAPTPALTERRIMVLVAGFGSSSNPAGIDEVDAGGLGYDPGDVLRFSYRGGRVPSPGPEPVDALGKIPSTTYAPADSLGDLPTSGDQLAALLAEVAAAEPGVPIDVVAHSQGGVVARLGITEAGERGDLPAEVATLVTLSSPHLGADLATAGSGIAATPRGASLLDLAGRLGAPLASDAPAITQLSEPSAVAQSTAAGAVVGGEGRGGVPGSVRFVSVAGRGDPVVAQPRTRAPGAVSTTVSVSGPGAHDALPGSAAAAREIGLAVAGRPPTCRSTSDRVTDVLVGQGISLAHDTTGAGLVGLAALL